MAETLETIKKYIGPFSGSQMDQIFYEILNYTSERYAKGTANGQAVAAGTIGYNDNSYYYSRQALQSAQAAANAAARAESAVPAGINSAVLWTTDQSTALTNNDKAVARKNIMAGGSNPNLFANWDFTNPVNQTGQTSWANSTDSGQYCLDPWTVFDGTAELTNDGMYFTGEGGTYGRVGFGVRFHLKTLEVGQIYTVSFIDGNDILHSKAFTFTGTASWAYIDSNFSINWNTASSRQLIWFRSRIANQTFTVKKVKLEKGSYSTLENDGFQDVDTESLRVYRNFYRLKRLTSATLPVGFGFALNETKARILIPTPVPMDTVTDVSMNGVFSFGTSAGRPVNAISYVDRNAQGIFLEVTTSGLTVNQPMIMCINSGTAYIDINARL